MDATTNRINTSGYAYDANGNMTNDRSNMLVYDAENRVLSATNGGSSGTYSYDGNSLRVKKVSGSTTTVYIFSGSKVIAEYSGTSTPYPLAREYIYSGGALLAKIESGATKYYHQDHLSNRVVTDSSGNTVAQLGHYPFGESWYNASGDKLLFTSYERDSESSNDYAMLRFHINRLGRFSSPDRLSGSIGDPQSLNRYFYAASDPVNLVDPSGMFIIIAPSPDPFGGPPDPWGWPPVGGGGGPILGPGCSYSFEPDDFGNYGIDCSDSGPFQKGGGHGGGGGAGKRSYALNLKVLNDCLASLGINVSVAAFKPSTPGGNGYAIAIGPDHFSRGGQTVPIVVTNDAKSYNAAQLGPMCGVSAAFGCTLPSNPYNNFTNNNNTRFGTVTTQVHELGHSLFKINSGSNLIPEPNGEVGQALEDCVKSHNGIQRN